MTRLILFIPIKSVNLHKRTVCIDRTGNVINQSLTNSQKEGQTLHLFYSNNKKIEVKRHDYCVEFSIIEAFPECLMHG